MKKIVVHEFRIGDCEDIEIYAAEPIYYWKLTDQGKWVMDHCVEEPVWYSYIDPAYYGWQIKIVANLKDEDATFFNLKWSNK